MGLKLPLRVYVDTNVLIAALEGEGESARGPQAILRLFQAHPDLGVTSEITLAEILVPRNLVMKRMVFERIIQGGLLTLRPVTRDILIEGAALRQTIRHKLPDAIHVVTALKAQCTHVLSFDNDMRRLPLSLTHLVPDADGVSILKSALA